MAEYEVLWTDTATHDLNGIIEYIAEDRGAETALSILDRLELRADALFNMPNRGRIVPELQDIGVFQYRQLSETPWRIIYRIRKEVVYVVAVIDGRRDFIDLLLQRLIQI
ncbi:type II toxin-antitoxin system RelE/ParE family toxin [Mariprofundus sp. EBB-1]|uniref:type II toxin-antitoxin system RelE/ParE family toxin n=1 Tax=Mariprofundus sp. EBB-1 TaxID=2650971 RepID=UPI000EF23000|nr:type II toxin-antitoxin system RelE/ParE family toxin [Mariprofundus sp. EBB-1]RLL50795.1 type II toxin-antitoxin system RelE/ParE family toxin [Mariprofundus sp. EBB-1]